MSKLSHPDDAPAVVRGSVFSEFSGSAVAVGMLAAMVGFTSSFAVILQGLTTAGATPAQAASGLISMSIGMGLSGVILSLRYRLPIGVAWSLPGAALLITSADSLNSINEAIGVYVFSSVLLVMAGLYRPLGRLIEAIPTTLANAMLAAPFGTHGINLAAVTAAMFASEEAHADPQRRYWSAAIAGLTYIVIGLFAGAAGLLISLVPAVLIEAIAGLALLGAFSTAIVGALSDSEHREAAAVTFLFSGSGVAFLGVGGAFWGLLVGGMMYAVANHRKRRRQR